MAWERGDVTFEFREDGLSEDDVVTVRITTPDGVVHLMAELEEVGGGLRLSRLHIHADNGRNTLGHAKLRRLARWALKRPATMKSSLKARLARLGPIQDVSRVASGSPLVLALSPSRATEEVLTIPATLALAKRGLTLLRAKRVIEEMCDKGRAVAQVPAVEDETALARELGEAGCRASRLARPEVDVRVLRERLGLTQEQFALRYALDVDTVRNWESRRRHPDAAALAYLGVIASLPEQVSMVLERPLASARADC